MGYIIRSDKCTCVTGSVPGGLNAGSKDCTAENTQHSVRTYFRPPLLPCVQSVSPHACT